MNEEIESKAYEIVCRCDGKQLIMFDSYGKENHKE